MSGDPPRRRTLHRSWEPQSLRNVGTGDLNGEDAALLLMNTNDHMASGTIYAELPTTGSPPEPGGFERNGKGDIPRIDRVGRSRSLYPPVPRRRER